MTASKQPMQHSIVESMVEPKLVISSWQTVKMLLNLQVTRKHQRTDCVVLYFLKSMCAYNFFCATFCHYKSVCRMKCKKYVQQENFLRNTYASSKFSCVCSSHNLCAHAHVHTLEGTLVQGHGEK